MPFERGGVPYTNPLYPLDPNQLRILQLNWWLREFGGSSGGALQERMPTFPDLPGSSPNPSSQHELQLIERTFAGRQGRMRGAFITSTGTTQSDWGFTAGFLLRQNPAEGGTGTDIVIALPDAIYQDGVHLARRVEVALRESLDPDIVDKEDFTVRYVDERNYEDPQDGGGSLAFGPYVFRIRHPTIKFKIRKYSVANGQAHDDSLQELLGYADAGAGATYLNMHTGQRRVHGEDWFILDCGASAGLWMPAVAAVLDAADWVCLKDWNFDRADGPISIPDNSASWDEISLGMAHLALYASNSLADLENDWTDLTKFVEGKNRWTFYNGGLGIAAEEAIGIGYGDDSNAHLYRIGDNNQSGAQARYIVANLQAWAAWKGQAAPGVRSVVTNGYRYWMWRICNPGNWNGRIMIGPMTLSPSFYLGYNYSGQGHSMGAVDRATLTETELGARLGRNSVGDPGREVTLPLRAIPEHDMHTLERTWLRQTVARGFVNQPHGIGIGAGRGKGGRNRIMWCIDPGYDPYVQLATASNPTLESQWARSIWARGAVVGHADLSTPELQAQFAGRHYEQALTIRELPSE